MEVTVLPLNETQLPRNLQIRSYLSHQYFPGRAIASYKGFTLARFVCRDILKEFTTDELIDWLMFENKFGKFLTTSLPGNVVFPQDSVGKTRWSDIKSRVIGHVGMASYLLSVLSLVLFAFEISVYAT